MLPGPESGPFDGLFARAAVQDEAIVATDARLRIVGWNAAAERLYGWTAQEVIGKPVSAVLRSELSGRQRAELLSTVSQEGELAAEYIHHDRHGQPLHVVAVTLALRDRTGALTGYVSVNREASRQRQRDQEYVMLRQAMLVGRSFAFEWLPRTDQVRRSQECAAILGLAGAADAYRESGADYLSRVHPDDRARFAQTILGLTPEQGTYRVRYRVMRGDDVEITLEEFGRGEFDAEGTLVQLYGMTADVSEAVRAERELRVSRDNLSREVDERTRELRLVIASLEQEIGERRRAQAQVELQTAALRAAANGIIITDQAGRIKWANPAFTHMTGYTQAEVLGRTPSFLKSGLQGPEVYTHLWETILAGNVWSGEIVNRRKDGTLYVEEQTITPVYGPDDNVAHFIAIKHDISERKAAEQELQRRHLELVTLNLVGSALTHSLALADVLATCRGLLAAKLEGAGGAVYLCSAATGGVQLETAWGEATKEDRAAGACDSETGATGPAADCIAQVLATREVVVGQDRLCIPLLAQGRLLGVLDLLHPFRGSQPSLDLSFYEALGREVGGAIQNAVLFEEVAAGRQRLQALSRRLVEVQEAERRHIARELHDEAGQVLMGLKLGLGQLERNADRPDIVRAQVAELRQMANGVLETLHTLAVDLRPASLEHLGLIQALQQYAETISDRHGVVVDFEAVGVKGRLPAHIENALYRIVQEAIANVVNHARATRVDVLLEQRREKLILMIEDDGVGFDEGLVLSGKNGRLGLVGIRERTEMLGGSLFIESEPGAGTTILVEAPYVVADSDRG